MSVAANLELTARDRYAMFAAKNLNRLDGTRPHIHETLLDSTQWWGVDAIRVWRRARLTELLTHAHAKVRFYRERIDAAGGVMACADEEGFARLPLLTKDDMRLHAYELVTRSLRGLIPGMTSGTTGAPIRVWHDHDFTSWLRALQRRAFLWFGVEPTQPSFYFGGPPHTLFGKAKQRVIDLSIVRRCAVCYDMRPQALDRVIDQLRRFRPRIVTGFPSALWGLVCRAEETAVPLHDIGIRLVMPVSEITPPHFREKFERVFGAPLLLEYGCVEIGAMAFSCPAGSLHASHEHVIFEVLGPGGRAAPPGEVGRVVLTPLLSKAMPLIRYELGDLARLAHGMCPCGRYPGLPYVERLEGRSFDQMIDKDGKAWHAFIIYYALKEVFDPLVFREFQSVQPSAGKLDLLIVPGPKFDPGKADRLVEAVKVKVGGPVDVEWKRVDAIDREGSGKFKYFKSLIPKHQN